MTDGRADIHQDDGCDVRGGRPVSRGEGAHPAGACIAAIACSYVSVLVSIVTCMPANSGSLRFNKVPAEHDASSLNEFTLELAATFSEDEVVVFVTVEEVRVLVACFFLH
ncbi:hypothetical protein KJK32_10095 [Streptomyces sp. JCM17656]|nr:hypothetical protein KJK32_10095 [Streptomyces sp. JCM17656]